MNILLVAATDPESHHIKASFDFVKDEDWYVAKYAKGNIYLLITGIGMTSTAYMLGKFLAIRKVELAINFGIAGSFARSIPLGEVVEVTEDSFAELGAEDGPKWLNLEDIGFPQFIQDQKKFYNTFSNPTPSPFDIRKCKAITVNRTHGHESSIQKVQAYWPVQLETMEGAAFFQAMIREQLPFYGFRAISNYVERRDRDRWEIPLAVENMQAWMLERLEGNYFMRS